VADHDIPFSRLSAIEKGLADHMAREEVELTAILQAIHEMDTRMEVFIATEKGRHSGINDRQERVEAEVIQLRNNWNKVFWGVLTAVGGGFTTMFYWIVGK
jgi:bifunctional N-acetylglucosamine-1-phosphate-uridyltransferase/glucosamine-1-phosphate-acetyltransferase GlmU-like protein